jgi:hypothetical protein
MATLTLQKQPSINDGMQVTYQGDPGICTYWEVVAGGSGSLSESILITDLNGVAVNQYTSSTSPGDIGTTVTIKVTNA